MDVTGDGKKDLVITGEWMAPRIFTFSGNKFTEVKTNLNNLMAGGKLLPLRSGW